ncbi:MAG: hypothetical protein LC750_12675 [Actinobacteria bacterium]|nr:hypothetical protein [Actinomycetota bacterium]
MMLTATSLPHAFPSVCTSTAAFGVHAVAGAGETPRTKMPAPANTARPNTSRLIVLPLSPSLSEQPRSRFVRRAIPTVLQADGALTTFCPKSLDLAAWREVRS